MIKNKKYTYSYKEYEGHSNEQIISLINELNDLLENKRQIEKEIEKIQSECEHEYMFVAKGMYDDSYKCCKCGHETEK